MRVIRRLRADPCTLFSLDAMAEVAALSPSHFSRVFRRTTGIAPGAFQAALRMEAAKHLLLTTELSITDICFAVGYISLGTFTSRFTRLVGLPPSTLRRMAMETPLPRFRAKWDAGSAMSALPVATLRGTVRAAFLAHLPPDPLIFVGLFPQPLPQGRPIACTVVTSQGPFSITPIPDGRYYLLAAALPYFEDLRRYATTTLEPLVANGNRPVRVREGVVRGPHALELRRPLLTDPPLVAALPFMLAHSLAASTHARYEALA